MTPATRTAASTRRPTSSGAGAARSTTARTRFVSSFVYGLPCQKEGWLGWLVNGWQVAGLFTAQSGTPLDITMDGALLRAPGNTQRPDMDGDPEILGDVGGGKTWFDTTVFAAPAPNTFGNLTRNGAGINGPGYVQPRRLAREEVRHGPKYGEFRVDAFNLTNSLHANNPNSTFGGGDVRADHRRLRPAAGPVRPAVRLLACARAPHARAGSRLEAAALRRRRWARRRQPRRAAEERPSRDALHPGIIPQMSGPGAHADAGIAMFVSGPRFERSNGSGATYGRPASRPRRPARPGRAPTGCR